MQSLSAISDDTLLHHLRTIVVSHRRVTAELILHLGEVDARRLHVEKGFPSLFSYCVKALCFSEDEACRRIEAARLARRFPAIHALLETAAVSLTVLGLLKPHLTDANQRELLAGVAGASVREAKEWLATRFPVPDVVATIRKQAVRRRAPIALPGSLGGRCCETPLAATAVSASAESALKGAIPFLTAAPSAPTRTESPHHGETPFFGAAPPAPTRTRIDPLSQDRFLVKFTASRAMRDKLELARNLLREANPGGDLAVVLERAVDLLVAELQKKKQGRTSRPQKTHRPAKDTHVTRAARREVVARDGWRCSFVADDGRRCDASAFIEFDHETPKARGGGSQPENLRLLCRAHNLWAAERVYGKAHVSRAISDARRDDKDRILVVRETLAHYSKRPTRCASGAGGRARWGSRAPRALCGASAKPGRPRVRAAPKNQGTLCFN